MTTEPELFCMAGLFFEGPYEEPDYTPFTREAEINASIAFITKIYANRAMPGQERARIAKLRAELETL